MADEADIAAKYQEHLNATAKRAYAQPDQQATGRCAWCDEAVDAGLFCDADCRHDWEKFNRRQRNGG